MITTRERTIPAAPKPAPAAPIILLDSGQAWRWRAIDDPPPEKPPTRFQRLTTWLVRYNEY